ncbi:diguanylate cyclase [Yersinia enterocolitica]|nr:diguanylate cyclase [Yersinia enterocolitica]
MAWFEVGFRPTDHQWYVIPFCFIYYCRYLFFKSYNDEYGHQEDDFVLKNIAR